MDEIKLYDLDIEKYILGSAITSKVFLKRIVDKLMIDCFSLNAHKKIYEIIKKLYLNNESVNVDVIIEKLGSIKLFDDIENIDYLNELVNTCIIKSNLDNSIKILYEKSILRNLLGNIKEQNFNTYDFRTINEIIPSITEKIENKVIDKELRKIDNTTGFYELDKALNNLNNNELIVIAGRSSMGKTTLVSNIAVNNSRYQKDKVIFYSLETNKDEITQKMISSFGQLSDEKLNNGELSSNDWKKLNESIEQLNESNLIINDKFDITIDEIIETSKIIFEKNNISLIIIDSLDYFLFNNIDNKRSEINEYLKKLKFLSRKINVPIILTVNLPSEIDNRKDKRPKLKDLNKIANVDNYADVIMFIYRNDYYYEEAIMNDNISLTNCIIAKNKNGITKELELLLKKDTHTFYALISEREE